MFWSGNYIAVRELNSLLKEENVSLSQVLEADDILQECKADNKALIQFLTKPETLADLITLITEEPPKNVELSSQYRHANIACEVLTSHLSMLSDRLSLDTAQMNRLCDFINKDPPLNPLLASYFSKTVEMLLEKNPKQDWCLHHIVCLRVLDFFKSRRDFLPNLFRHMSTSAIADIFKCLLRIDDLIKTVMEWLEEHQFLECLIQIICGTYVAEVFPSPQVSTETVEKAQREISEKVQTNHKDEDRGETPLDGENAETSKSDTSGENSEPSNGVTGASDVSPESNKEANTTQETAEAAAEAKALAADRVAAAASANAAALLCDLIINGCRMSSVRRAVGQLRSERGVGALLAGMFTCGARARRHALVNGTHVLLALLHHTDQRVEGGVEEEAQRTYTESCERGAVELAVAPHVPLLHQALLHHEAGPAGGVGPARLQVAALLAHLALSEVEEVATTMLTLGTPGVLLQLFFAHAHNNFLHAHVHALVKHALNNKVYRTQYARHLLIECDLLTRLMDVFEENKNKKDRGAPRAAYMGHVVLCLALAARALGSPDAPGTLGHELDLPRELAQRWATFLEQQLRPLLQQHDTPLGGYYPPENFYEVEVMPDTLADNYDYSDMATNTIEELTEDGRADRLNQMCGAAGSSRESAEFIADGLGIDPDEQFTVAKNNFLELACQRFDDNMWEESCGGVAEVEEEVEEGEGEGEGEVSADLVRDVLEQHSPWECTEGGGGGGGEGWAQFSSEPFLAPSERQSPPTPPADQHFAQFSPFWTYDRHTNDPNSSDQLESNLRTMRLDEDDKSMDEASSVELANNLLTAMSAMSANAIANIINANLPSPSAPTGPTAPSAPAPAPDSPQAPTQR